MEKIIDVAQFIFDEYKKVRPYDSTWDMYYDEFETVEECEL